MAHGLREVKFRSGNPPEHFAGPAPERIMGMDPSGALLSGVRVEEKGTLSGTLTDAQGRFTFGVSST